MTQLDPTKTTTTNTIPLLKQLPITNTPTATTTTTNITTKFYNQKLLLRLLQLCSLHNLYGRSKPPWGFKAILTRTMQVTTNTVIATNTKQAAS